jgi:hypothetical protein
MTSSLVCGNCKRESCRKSLLLKENIKSHNNKNFNIKSGNSKIDLFIEETQKTSLGCNDFIEWIPIKKINKLHFLTSGGFSKIYDGNWSLSDSNKINHSKIVVIKVLKNSNINNDVILNEVY